MVVSSFDDYVRSLILVDSKAWVQKKDKPTLREYTPQPLLVEFRKTAGLKVDRIKLPRKKATHPLVYNEASSCANALLKTTPYRNSHKIHRDLSDIVRWAFHPYCLHYPDLPEDKGRYLFMVGSDSSKIISTSAGMAVIAGTNVALPFDREQKLFYVPFSRENNQVNVLGLSSWKLVSSDRGKKLSPKPPIVAPLALTGKALPFQTAEEAFGRQINPRLAAWYLEQLPSGGRRYVDFNPWSSEEEKSVRKEHLKTYTEFRETAVEACIAKWGRVIPPRKIESYFSNGKLLNFPGKEIYVRTNAHHRIPVSFGGDNSERTLIEKSFHNYIHQDFNQTQANVFSVLKQRNPKFEVARLPSEAKLRKFLIKRPDAVKSLNKLPYVQASTDGTLSLAILWPPEIYCVPSLIQFEGQNGGIYPVKNHHQDRGPHIPTKTFASSSVNALSSFAQDTVHF